MDIETAGGQPVKWGQTVKHCLGRTYGSITLTEPAMLSVTEAIYSK